MNKNEITARSTAAEVNAANIKIATATPATMALIAKAEAHQAALAAKRAGK